MVREILWESLPRKIFFQEIWASWMRAVPACYGLFRVVPFLQAKMSQNDLQIYYKSTSARECKCHYKVRQRSWITKSDKWYYKVGQVRGNFYHKVGQLLLQSGAKKYKQNRRQMKETGEIDFGNLVLHSALITWRQRLYP